jgi:hypothetical protein
MHKNKASSDFPGDKIELYIIIKEFLRKLKQKIEENNFLFYNIDIKLMNINKLITELKTLKSRILNG